ncbi:HupE/UreJ family protein [Paralimibaculum aggregatum]|uniref:HupE/UreJ family protein n=1 Tax=Paralimibaculum aggregatum TaxID=3036245 RepID=A0ABQ6LJT9_9RHOB|nr:HupE/UreJ family protein [Limibaculum sp. NKW23]GMG83523.1 HupE/UreJ family protein [Limibaculum sp. NKW23]
MRTALLAALLLLAGLLPQPAAPHALQPAYLELARLGEDTWRITWRRPAVGGRPMAIAAALPDACSPRRGPAPAFDGGGFTSRWIARCAGGLRGGRIAVEGLAATRTDVLLRYETADGRAAAVRLTPDAPAATVPEDPGAATVLATYLPLGVEHILEGIDHLLFVLALLLLVRRWRRLLAAVTAFTLAHSLTLAGATLGLIDLPGPPVEAVIALSIVMLAAEVARPAGAPETWAARRPWAVAFGFGLLHGLGFAGALREIGLPETDLAMALLAFNLGVELGQIAFIAAVAGLALLLGRLWPRGFRAAMAPGGAGLRALAYGIGSLAAFWTVERIAAF